MNNKYQKDIIDIFHFVIHSKKNNKDSAQTKPKNLLLAIAPAIGYTQSSGFLVSLASNSAFHTTKDQSLTNLSVVNANISYTQYDQLLVPLQGNIWTKNNKYNLISDFRYYILPKETYGLGSMTKPSNYSNIDFSYLRIYQSILRKMGRNFFVGMGYHLDYHWNIIQSNPFGSGAYKLREYGLESKSVSSGPVLQLLFDNRKNPINASNGGYVNLIYRHNTTLLGSNANWQSLVVDIRKYFKTSSNKNNVLAIWNYNWFSFGDKAPYLDLPSTSWDSYNNTGRGYTQGRFRGKNMLYLEGEYRFQITNNGLLGGVVFANAETFSEYPSNNFSHISLAAGPGLRIKFNKHSNTNVAIDYGFGEYGSKGISVNLGEVF